MNPRNILGMLVLAVCALMFSAGPCPALASAYDNDSVEQSDTTFDQGVTASADINLADVIVEKTAVCNVADRVTETVERNFVPATLSIPEAPSFAILHVPRVTT